MALENNIPVFIKGKIKQVLMLIEKFRKKGGCKKINRTILPDPGGIFEPVSNQKTQLGEEKDENP